MSEGGGHDPGKLTPEAGSVLKVVFLTLFIDLVGFSIIFPLFPSMLNYYSSVEGDAGLFGWLLEGLRRFSVLSGTPTGHWGEIVLFGGVLGSLYSLLQFLCAPFFGSLSDRIGRRPVLLFCLVGILVSYGMWFVAGSFAMLVAARFVGGMMSGNISTATAIVADVTSTRTRSKGMALVGIAFGLGFIIGPALGGLLGQIDLTEHFPALAAYGVNPYSAVAALAFALTLLNIVLVMLRVPETRPERVGNGAVARTVNPLRLFSAGDYPGVNLTNATYFLFMLAFAGMEFSLTFLAVERLGYTSLKNVLLFLFAGVVQILVQGGYVQRRAGVVGPKRMAVQGLIAVAPGFVLVGCGGQFQSEALLYMGLFFLAMGAGMASPCLSALVSVYTPAHDQGRIMGVFRSLGALARALGPVAACIIYWRLDGAQAYYLCALFMLAPLLMAQRLPRPNDASGPEQPEGQA